MKMAQAKSCLTNHDGGNVRVFSPKFMFRIRIRIRYKHGQAELTKYDVIKRTLMKNRIVLGKYSPIWLTIFGPS